MTGVSASGLSVQDGGSGSRPREMTLAARERLVLAAACALQANGQATEDTAEAAGRLGRALGLSASMVLRWDEILLQTETTGGNGDLRLHAVTPTTVGMNRVEGAMRCIEAVCAADLLPADADEAIGAAAARRTAWPK